LIKEFKVLYPLRLSKEVNSVVKFGYVLKVLNQNQLVNMVKAQLGEKQTIEAFEKVETKSAQMKLDIYI
jgi:hypothetical protein